MTSNLPLVGALLLVLACSAFGQAKLPGQRLTEDELLRHIESLSPQSGDPLKMAPASVTESARVQAGEAKTLNERVATTSAVPEKDEPKAKKPKGATEITADSVDFDQKAHQAVFIGHVVVKDPEFDLQCDKLTAFLKSDKNGAETPTAKRSTPEEPGKKKSGGLERALAEGNVLITQDKLESDGSVSKSVGRAARANYSAVTGEMILSGNPEVQQGMNTCVATDPSTKMYMKRDGKMRVEGPSKMIIRDQGESK